MIIYDSISSQWVDMAGKHRVQVTVADGANKNSIILKFQKQPTEQEIVAEAQRVIDTMNIVPEKVVTNEEIIESLKAEIALKDKTIADLRAKQKEVGDA